jgi:AcrR family transcriptional regulator
MRTKAGDHRTRVTRMLLRRALTDAMRGKPIAGISVKELCERAGVNRGTFYAHYRDIYDLLEQMEREMLEDFKAALEPLLDAEGEGITPLKVTAGIFRCIRDNADLCSVTLGPNGDKAFAARVINIGRERCMETYSALFAGAPRVVLEYYYAFVSAGCIGLLEKWLGEGMTTDVEELARVCEGLMMQGVEFLRQAGEREE